MMRRLAGFSSTLLCRCYFALDLLEKDIAGSNNRFDINWSRLLSDSNVHAPTSRSSENVILVLKSNGVYMPRDYCQQLHKLYPM